MTRPLHEADDDSFKSWQLGIAAQREHMIRTGVFDAFPSEPDYKHAARWKAEGPKPWHELDTVRADGTVKRHG